MTKPDASYVKLQRELQTLIEQSVTTRRRGELKTQLEAKFMAAWGFTRDRLRLGARLRDAITLASLPAGELTGGFDHCSYYTGAGDQRIIVTQPYGDFEEKLRIGLRLDDSMVPEVIAATKWAFYCPGHSQLTLTILKFPWNYGAALRKFKDAALRASKRTAITGLTPSDSAD